MTALAVTDLHVRGPHGPIVAGLNLTVEAGETHAIVGESGSGKSVSAKALTGLLPPGLTASGALTISGAPVP
ncbi:MAG: ATP-binding cassette domain-containing protein, partial [Streptosporangiaceae bacterium]